MTFTELLAAIRKTYAATLAEAISQSAGAHSEPAFRNKDGSLAVEGPLSLPCRADLIPTQGAEAGRPFTVDSKTGLGFEPQSLSLSQTRVYLAPFTWDWVSLQVVGLSLTQMSDVIVPWFMRWFDQEDENLADSEGLRGVVHFVSDPEDLGDSVRSKVDLGSAPEASLEDLVFCLSDAGAHEVHIA